MSETVGMMAFGSGEAKSKDLYGCELGIEHAKLEVSLEGIPESKAYLHLLGRICIYSECGYISDYVVKKLSEVAEYSCNHMG